MSVRTSFLLVAAGCFALSIPSWGQVVAQDPASAEPLQVVIEREPLSLRSPESYRVSLHLDPIKTVHVAAQVDGVVNKILAEMGQSMSAHAEVLRLDSRDRQLQLERAKAALAAARLAQKSASGSEKELADARVKVAEIDVELAQYHLDQAIVRSPFDGTVQRVHVVEGQFVRAGEPLATIVDTTRLQVEIPVDRKTTQSGNQIELAVEGRTTAATVQGILPLSREFEPLRDLFESVATGLAILDNSGNQFQAGQTVYAAMIPRHPVSEVPNLAIGNTDEGERRVQVIRNGFVRNVIVELLGAVGEERTIVTGRFSPEDELIISTSEELLDGTQVVPRMQLEAATDRESGGAAGRPPAAGPGQPPRGF